MLTFQADAIESQDSRTKVYLPPKHERIGVHKHDGVYDVYQPGEQAAYDAAVAVHGVTQEEKDAKIADATEVADMRAKLETVIKRVRNDTFDFNNHGPQALKLCLRMLSRLLEKGSVAK